MSLLPVIILATISVCQDEVHAQGLNSVIQTPDSIRVASIQ